MHKAYRSLFDLPLSKYVLVCGLALSIVACLFVKKFEDDALEEKFRVQAISYFLLIEQSWAMLNDHLLHVVNAIGAELWVDAHERLAEQDFRGLSHTMPWQDGLIQRFAWLPLLYEQTLMCHQTAFSAVPSPLHSPVGFVKSSQNDAFLAIHQGQDMLTDPRFRHALRHVLKTNKPSAVWLDKPQHSAVVSLIYPVSQAYVFSASKDQPHARVCGFVLTDVDLAVFLEHAIERHPASGIHIQLYDEQDQLLYSHISRTSKTAKIEDLGLNLQKELPFLDHMLHLRLQGNAAFIAKQKAYFCWMVLLLGILLTLVLSLSAAFFADKKRLYIKHKKLSTVLEQASQGVLMMQPDAVIEYVNARYMHSSGFSEVDLVAHKIQSLVHDEDTAALSEGLQSMVLAGKVWRSNIRLKRQDGTSFPAFMTVSPVLDEAGKIYSMVAMVEDQTERELIELSLQQSQRLESLATLVAGFSHHFNNLLSVMMGKAYVARRSTQSAAVLACLTDIETIGARSSKMIRQLLLFSRVHDSEKCRLSLLVLAKDVVQKIQPSLPKSIQLQTDFCEDPLWLEGNAEQLMQLMLSLLHNAIDAIDDEGTGRIGFHLALQQEDHFALVSVEDNGTGISPADIEHVFEPFFTTKDMVKGTGLGLSTAYGIVEDHGGHIWVKNKPDAGALFRFYLPLM